MESHEHSEADLLQDLSLRPHFKPHLLHDLAGLTETLLDSWAHCRAEGRWITTRLQLCLPPADGELSAAQGAGSALRSLLSSNRRKTCFQNPQGSHPLKRYDANGVPHPLLVSAGQFLLHLWALLR